MPKQNILIVDDDEIIIEILKKTLENNGYTCLSTNNGQEGLDTLKKHDNIDAVILDIMMPEMNGQKTLKKIRQSSTTKNLPVLMLTSKNQISDVSDCLELGANDYMVKPFDPPTCIARLQRILPPPAPDFEKNSAT